MESLNKKRCVIVAAGEISDNSIIRNNIFYDDYVIAADAGFKRCQESGVIPDLVVGDFDSAPCPKTDIETIVLNPVKDCTDTEYAVTLAYNKGFKEILILGGMGGRLDHTFANLAVLAAFKQKSVNITMLDNNHRIYALKDEKRTLINENKYVSVFSYGKSCYVTLKGFFYPLDNYHMVPFEALGVSNEIVNDTAQIIISDGTAIIMEVNKDTF